MLQRWSWQWVTPTDSDFGCRISDVRFYYLISDIRCLISGLGKVPQRLYYSLLRNDPRIERGLIRGINADKYQRHIRVAICVKSAVHCGAVKKGEK